MSSLDFLQSRAIAKKGVVQLATTDTPVAIRLKTKAAAGAVTSVTTTTGTGIVFITANGGTDSYAFATYDTVAKLVDAINADGMFEARVLDTLRSFATLSQFVTGVITASVTDGVTYYDVLTDTDACLYLAKRLSVDRSVGENKPFGSHRVHLNGIKYYIDFGTAAADSLQIWEINGNTETQLAGYLTVDTTETEIEWAGGEVYITSGDGNEIVVLAKDAATLADVNTNYLEITGFIE